MISKGIFESIETKIIGQLAKWLKVGEEEDSYLEPISDFLTKAGSKDIKLDFITLNYDLVFKKHFNSKNYETLLNSGFTSNGFTGFDNAGKEETRINYYKLHGSLNWYKDENGLVNSVDYNSFIENPSPEPMTIFGQGSKFLSVDPFITLLYDFKRKLEERDIYVVIGYSFFDPYINNLILEGLKKPSKNKKKMIVVNPGFLKQLLSTEEKKAENCDKILIDRFIDYLKSIQSSTYLSEQPNFNITEISTTDVKIFSLKTGEFFKEYFGDNAKELIQLSKELIKENEDVF